VTVESEGAGGRAASTAATPEAAKTAQVDAQLPAARNNPDPLMASAAAALSGAGEAARRAARGAHALRGKVAAAFARASAEAGNGPPGAAPDKTAQDRRAHSRDIPPAVPAPKKARAPKGAGPAPRGAPALLFETGAVAFSLGLAGIIAFLFAAFVMIAPRPENDADLWAVNRLPSIVVMDRNGEELAARGARYGQQVAVGELPPYLVKAIIATEDRRFFDHGGVDFRGTLRALYQNLRRGRVVEGGSTITQQLARNLFLTTEQTYVRKAKEALLAVWIEGRYSKEQILSLYLNRIYFGAGAYGVDSAARTYFDKSARDVTLAEAVMLAGLPKAPSQLAPTLNPGGAQTRANQVLSNLRETGAITEFEAREAISNPAVVVNGDESGIGWFFDYISEKARLAVGPREGDLIVTTTLDKRLQREAEAAVKAVIGTDARLVGAEQAALVAYDANGALRAMVGGRSYLESQFNRATQALRQPGSAFKPFVYAAALENGVRPDQVFIDQPIEIESQPGVMWRPENYTPGFQGRMRLTEAVARSINTIAVQVSEMIGRDKTVEMAKRLGVKSEIPVVASVALGGVNVTLEELTAAYLPFADEGVAYPVYAIERVEDQNLEVIYERVPAEPRRVLDPAVAEGMTHLLFQVMNSGTGAGASLGARVSAGKTGTTNDWRDAWFIGYTAQLVAGVWVGNDDFTPMDKVTGGTLPAEIWKQFMIAAHQDLPRAPLKGAYPASTFVAETSILDFYADVARDLREVRRDGDSRRDRRRRGR
jgi:penicillin-binding protein 1A